MTRYYLSLIFSAASLAGLGLLLYAIMAMRGANPKPAEGEDAVLGFSEPVEQGFGLLDLDTGHEGLKHREKEPFDPEKHKAEPL
jgi:hypothetical protein